MPPLRISIRWPSLSERQLFLSLLYPYLCILVLVDLDGRPEINAIGRPFVGPSGFGAYPLVLLGFLLLTFWFITRRNVRSHRALPAVPMSQYYIAALVLVLSEIFALAVTHPAPALSGRMYSFMDAYPAIGGPFMGAALYIIMLLPFIPASACFLPLSFFRKSFDSLIFGFLLFVSFLFSEVLNAYYYFLTGPWIVTSVKGFLGFISHSAGPSTGRWALDFRDFHVLLGYSCTELSSFLLFTGLFWFCWWRRRPTGFLRNFAMFGLFLLGLITLWFLNIFRIVSIMLIGSRYPDFAIGLFHSSIGPALFFVFFLVYIRTALRFLCTVPTSSQI